MGANPRWFTLSLSLPRKLATNSWLKGFSAGLAEVADEFKCSLVGGDTTSGALSISITMLGEVPSGSAITRGGAKDGDFIYVSGALGDGAAALSVIQGNKNKEKIDSERLLRRFYRPEPKIEFGIKLRDVASACIDISDGLVADLGHICRSSGVSANVKTHDVPINDDVRTLCGLDSMEWALFGGDDYHLCFTVPEHLSALVDGWSADNFLDLKQIGRMTPCKDGFPQVFLDGSIVRQENRGFDHFG
jgi:thiamine-monophosphate kinase